MFKKVSALLVMGLVLVGGGCSSASVDVTANDIEAEAFLLPIGDESIIPEPQVDGWRIQNFVGSDDPKAKSASDAYFIEIKSNVTRADFDTNYPKATSSDLGLGNKVVLFGKDGPMGGETWPNDAYYHEASKTMITIYGQTQAGKDAATALLQAIYWN